MNHPRSPYDTDEHAPLRDQRYFAHWRRETKNLLARREEIGAVIRVWPEDDPALFTVVPLPTREVTQ